MRSRRFLLLATGFLFTSALVAIGVLLYLYVWRTPSSNPVTGSPVQPTPQASATMSGSTAPLTPPPLVTPTTTPSPTPTGTPTFTPTPTPSPTPTLTPSPTPMPATRLARAYRAKRNGDYQRARNEFEALLASAEIPEAIEASYEIGVCALLDGDYVAARDRLAQFIQEHAEDHRIPEAHFYLAEALTGLQEYGAANEAYRAYLERQDILADVIYTRIAQNDERLQDYPAAAQAYQQALERAPDLGQQYDLREQIALTYVASEDYSQAIEWFQGIIERSDNVYRLARIWYLMGQSYQMAGQEQQAWEAYSRAVNGDPQPGYAHAALVVLVDANVPVNEYQRGLIDYYAGSYAAAVEAFHRYVETTPDYNSDAHYYTALSYLAAGSLDLAVKECERTIEAFPNTIPHWGELWLTRGQALAQMGQDDAAVEAWNRFADSFSEHPLASQARWQAAQLLEQAESFFPAADTYARLADRHPDADQAPAARFRAGICRYRGGDVDGAQGAWHKLIADYADAPESIQARYWLGKTLWSQGQYEEARSLLQGLAADYPRNYYGLRAAHWLAAKGPVGDWPQAPASLHLTSDEETERQQAEEWLRGWANAPEQTDLGAVSAKLAENVHLRRGTELAAIELREQAVGEFDLVRQEIGQDPIALYQLARLTRDLQLYAASVRTTIDLISLAPENSVLEMPLLIQRLAFPTYFSDILIPECDAYGLDPLLMFALIRQESIFDDQVASWAGAVGLSQIMPSTGEWIAEMMPWPGYHEELLKRPFLNVKFGTWFLARILPGVDGDIMAALAGYNGGPANSTRWLALAKQDPDLFVEVITRDEPGRYVREIYRHYDVYLHLYGN
jgi:soluble lytic murein transglycosylase